MLTNLFQLTLAIMAIIPPMKTNNPPRPPPMIPIPMITKVQIIPLTFLVRIKAKIPPSNEAKIKTPDVKPMCG